MRHPVHQPVHLQVHRRESTAQQSTGQLPTSTDANDLVPTEVSLIPDSFAIPAILFAAAVVLVSVCSCHVALPVGPIKEYDIIIVCIHHSSPECRRDLEHAVLLSFRSCLIVLPDVITISITPCCRWLLIYNMHKLRMCIHQSTPERPQQCSGDSID